MLDDALKTAVYEAVTEAIEQQSGGNTEYVGFADIDEFIKISGISKFDLEEKLMINPAFRKHVYKLGGRKRYIEVAPALKTIKSLMYSEGGY